MMNYELGIMNDELQELPTEAPIPSEHKLSSDHGEGEMQVARYGV